MISLQLTWTFRWHAPKESAKWIWLSPKINIYSLSMSNWNSMKSLLQREGPKKKALARVEIIWKKGPGKKPKTTMHLFATEDLLSVSWSTICKHCDKKGWSKNCLKHKENIQMFEASIAKRTYYMGARRRKSASNASTCCGLIVVMQMTLTILIPFPFQSRTKFLGGFRWCYWRGVWDILASSLRYRFELQYIQAVKKWN